MSDILTERQRGRLSPDRKVAQMAHAGGVKPTIEMWVEDGELCLGKAGQRMNAVSDVDLAVQRLLQGEKVFVQQYGPIVTQVQRTVQMALQKAGQ